MTSSRFTRVAVLTVLGILLASGTAVAQAEGRTPIDLGLTMTGAAPTHDNLGDFPVPERVFLLGSGEAFAGAVQCSPDAACAPDSHVYGWVSDPLFNETGVAGTFVGTYAVTIPLTMNRVQAGPVANGPVNFKLEVGYTQPNGNVHFHGAAEATNSSEPGAPAPVPSDTLPLTAGVLTSPVTLTIDLNGFPSVEAGARLALKLTITNPEFADFTFTTDGFPTLQYYYGNPDEADLDGDGIPDSLDDDADADGFTAEEETAVGTSDLDAAAHPEADQDGDGFTVQEEFDAGTSDNDADDFPGAGGFPWLILLAIVLVVVLLLGGGFAVLTVAGRKVRISVSHDGFQAIEQGQTAEYELELVATGKKEEMVPVELALKGVPEDWSATLEPAHLTLYAGTEEPEPQTAILRLTPPADEQYESEAQVVVTATPTDEEGKTSALNPGSSVKTKTIVNIGMTDPEGGKKKRKAKKDAEPAEGDEPVEAEEKPKRGGFLKRKKGEEEPEASDEPEESAAPAAGAGAAAATAGGKPQIGMGRMAHDPEDFSEGDQVTTTVTVRNKGDGPVEGLRLNLFVNDEKADTQEVNLGAGESTEVTFQWTAQPDENRVRIKGGLKGA